NLSANYIRKYFPEEKIFAQFMQAIELHLPSSLCPKALPITQQMLDIVYSLIQQRSDPLMRRLHIETQVFELLLLQFQQYNQLVGHQYASFITKKLRDKIVHAKDIVDKNLHNPMGLIALSKMVGTNEYYLKKGFKELFGTSVFHYITSHRMEHAKQLLLREGCNVNETAF
ncbi:AraC family transcriptional regulator, partial [Brucella sp. 21LCYQ03]|nr:AraC family transcriptional regulator [Brucella sp. 21LCYQ03]